ncbi:hypothetical protein KC678_02515 [Candidatus Dojkabacteria bacterium]|uniref:Uncharacterized protein n=1 Tax=Candidatus Dojkabacteria bacterium TaxID=2099670 RepID=A0A955ICN5_9BACT|nr:hypothetical protein [Candidatus Dojkabacteria bacterium]
MEPTDPTLDDGITWDYLRDNPEEMSIETLAFVGVKNISKAFNNFHMVFTGLKEQYRDMASEEIEEIKNEEPLDEDALLTFEAILEKHDRVISIKDGCIHSMIEDGFINELEKDKFTNFDYIYDNIIGVPFIDLQVNSNGMIAKPELVRGVNFTIELYKRMRSQGLSHWEDLCR